MYQFGNVPRPPVVDRIIEATSSWDDLGPRTIVGTCVHRMDGTLGGTDEYFRTTANRGGETGALTDFGIGGDLDAGSGRDGVIYQWNALTGRRAPWANGRANDLDRNGVAFVEHYGIVSVNRDLVSIELSGCSGESACGPETVVTPAQEESLAALIASIHDAAGVPFDVFPLHPRSRVVTCLEHWEFSTKACPYLAVRSIRDRYLARARELMRIAQTGATVVTADAVPAHLRVTATDGLNLRMAPGTSSPILATLAFGASLQATGQGVQQDGHIWLPVTDVTSGRTGYVAQEYCAAA